MWPLIDVRQQTVIPEKAAVVAEIST